MSNTKVTILLEEVDVPMSNATENGSTVEGRVGIVDDHEWDVGGVYVMVVGSETTEKQLVSATEMIDGHRLEFEGP